MIPETANRRSSMSVRNVQLAHKELRLVSECNNACLLASTIMTTNVAAKEYSPMLPEEMCANTKGRNMRMPLRGPAASGLMAPPSSLLNVLSGKTRAIT